MIAWLQRASPKVTKNGDAKWENENQNDKIYLTEDRKV